MRNPASVRGVSVRFGAREALPGVSFDLAPDTVTVLLGDNGAGKSTLLRCVLGLRRPDGGEVRVLGIDPVREARSARQACGYVPDQADACGWMTARDLFRFLRGQYPEWNAERARDLIERLRAPFDTRFDAMSRGESAKVMLAAALVPSPALLVLDEPFARLAPPVREDVLRTFLEEAPAAGGAALVATHDLDLAARAADRVLVLDGGRIVSDCGPAELAARGLDGLRALYPPCREGVAVR